MLGSLGFCGDGDLLINLVGCGIWLLSISCASSEESLDIMSAKSSIVTGWFLITGLAGGVGGVCSVGVEGE